MMEKKNLSCLVITSKKVFRKFNNKHKEPKFAYKLLKTIGGNSIIKVRINNKTHPIQELKQRINKGRFHIYKAQINTYSIPKRPISEKIPLRSYDICIKATNCLRGRPETAVQSKGYRSSNKHNNRFGSSILFTNSKFMLNEKKSYHKNVNATRHSRTVNNWQDKTFSKENRSRVDKLLETNTMYESTELVKRAEELKLEKPYYSKRRTDFEVSLYNFKTSM